MVVVVVVQSEQMCLLTVAFKLTWKISVALFSFKAMASTSCICPTCGIYSGAAPRETSVMVVAPRNSLASLILLTKDFRLKRKDLSSIVYNISLCW